jgi:hypothetical protein
VGKQGPNAAFGILIPFPTLLAEGELSLPIKGREGVNPFDTRGGGVRYFRLIRMAG